MRIYRDMLIMQPKFLTTALIEVSFRRNSAWSIPAIQIIRRSCMQQTQQHNNCGVKRKKNSTELLNLERVLYQMAVLCADILSLTSHADSSNNSLGRVGRCDRLIC